ncbi:MAG: hypothetical protein DHS20C17_21700 [Cyclobacteriaceae bacterium]|nr:MAG: hypothetical protein DHS20C17_21700 [Cyclobacteriaceae bacterium]
MQTAILTLLTILTFEAGTIKDSPLSFAAEPLFIEIACLEKVPIVKVQLNDKEAFFVLDSGSDISIINRLDLDKFQFTVKKTASRDVKGFAGEQRGIYRVNQVKLALGDHEINSSFFATDLKHLVRTIENHTSITVNGILGLDIMKEYGFTIDYLNMRLSIDLKSNR